MRVFDWEVDNLEEFMSLIEGFFLVEGTKDNIIWAPLSSGRFFLQIFQKINLNRRSGLG